MHQRRRPGNFSVFGLGTNPEQLVCCQEMELGHALHFFNGFEQVAKCICLYLELCIFLLFV